MKSPSSLAWLLVALAGAGLGGCGAGDLFSGESAPAITGATVKRGPLAIRVVERGSLKAADFVSIRNELEGSSTILSLIKEGTMVKDGDLICELDATGQIEKRVQQEISVRNADAAYVKSEQNFAIQESQNESDIAKARQALAFAEQDLRKYLEGDKKLALSKAEQEITLQEEEFKRAKNKLDWSTKLAEKGFLTATELEADALSKNRAEVLLDQARKENELLVGFQVQRDTDELEANLAEAKRELDRVILQAKARLVDFDSDKRTNQAKLKLETEKLAKLDNQIAKAKIYARKAGMVVYAKQEEGGRGGMGQQQPIQEGTQVRERQEIVTIPTAGGMVATVSLHESVLKQVRPGLKCNIRVDALNNQEFAGLVKSVALLPDQNSMFANPNTRLYTTMVEIFGVVEEMRPGMSCAVEIRVDDIADTLYTPVQSIFRHQGKTIAFVDKGGEKYDVVEVKIGRFNDSHVEVLSGLSEGQVVLLAPPASFQLQPGTTTEEPKPGEVDSPPRPALDDAAVPPNGAAENGEGEGRGRWNRGGENAGANGGTNGSGRGSGGQGGPGGRRGNRGSRSGGGQVPESGGAAAEGSDGTAPPAEDGKESPKEPDAKGEKKDSAKSGGEER